MSRKWFIPLFPLTVLLASLARAEAPPKSEVDVILWFDTEDYLSPSDDDAAKRLADLLSARHLRATFKVVGEKARVLEKRGRTDVIEALRQHDIGFHANYHSVHPTPSEYLADCGLLDGMAEFVRREGPGAADVRRIFRVPSLVCYGQPGSSWGSQTIAALPQIGVSNDGIPCYVDSGNHVGIGGKPFWYCGALVVYDMAENETRMDLFAAGGLEQGEKKFAAIHDRLAREGGGLISIFYHPCEWVTSEFWDGVNFRRGANPPREQWKLPTQRSAGETDAAFTRFEAYIDFIRALPQTRFVTASELPRMYPDRLRTAGATDEEMKELTRRLLDAHSKGIDYQIIGSLSFSPADQFELLVGAVARQINGKLESHPLSTEPLLGPDAPPPASADHAPVTWPAFRAAVLDVRDYLHVNHRIPPRVFLGPDAIAPADFLIALASAASAYERNGSFPDAVPIAHGTELLTASHVVKDGPDVFGGWIIHPENFRAPKILDVARLQCWTLKPAMR